MRENEAFSRIRNFLYQTAFLAAIQFLVFEISNLESQLSRWNLVHLRHFALLDLQGENFAH
jgi:hypothetical protein